MSFVWTLPHPLLAFWLPLPMLQDGDANPLDQYEAVEEEMQEEEEEGEDLMENMERWAACGAWSGPRGMNPHKIFVCA